ncbi:hypothetical protein JIN84_19345 [Luteolibacter yonseiensis]|uniref:DUF4129 domain-containing protein n=1 Tax=Luteolibacter yonseiensis TaxID=1144680 RepID=A0A934R6D1_9BACT|nr:hypothetical protein [Luteolibacter yonseiensis]MBK1817784.1 hypothetical protein [Luteolibacter yonseiensis]
MRLDTVTAEIRPRSDWEAVDLGFAMVRRSFWRCLTVWWLAIGIPTAIAAVFLWDHPIVLLILFWWWKPAGSRLVLFELSRRLFGEEPTWKSVWREIPRAWWRRFFYRYIWARFSPWMPVTLAVEDLEGLRGKPYRLRCGQLVRRGEGAVMWLSGIGHLTVEWLGFGILVLIHMMLPEGQDGIWQQTKEAWDPNFPLEIPLAALRVVVGSMMFALSLTDIFVIGAGFGIYINNRTWIEGWDVELAFKRLAQRLGKVALLLLSFSLISLSARAGETGSPAEVIQEVKSDKAFEVHSVMDRVQKSKTSSSRTLPVELIQAIMVVSAVCTVVLLVGLVGWMVWKNRHAFQLRGGAGKEKGPPPAARVVMGMEVSPDSLPTDIPTAAWVLWQQGRQQDALGLLYRGSISRVIETGRVEIHESDTEGDCMRRVEQTGVAAHPGYFRGITGMWIRLAYAGVTPPDAEVRAACEQWPFEEGRRR